MPTNTDELLRLLETIVLRLPQRKQTDYHQAILAQLHAWRAGTSDLSAAWSELKDTLLSTPQYFFFIFRDLAQNEEGLLDLVKRQYFERGVSDTHQFYQTDLGWIDLQGDDSQSTSMMSQILQYLAYSDYKKGTVYEYFSIYFTFIDLMYSHFVRPEVKPVQAAIYEILYLQAVNWPKAYCAGNAYQGLCQLGVSGGKPTELRMAHYDVDGILNDKQRVLDIGSNSGFMSLYFAQRCKHVDALEYNPYLCQIGHTAAAALSISNVSYLCSDYFVFRPRAPYDVVVSCANHATIDNRLSMSFEDYIRKIYAMLHDGGYFLFESHNVFGPGKGGPGDDGDLDAKFDIAERYFEVIKHRMVAAFFPDHDVDKLFVVMKKRDRIDPNARRTLQRSDAIRRYQY